VTAPYSGASSYFGRKVTRTREHATVQGVNDDGTVLVVVRRGQGSEQHTFRPDQLRRLPRRGVKAAGARVGRVKARLELKGLHARQRAASAEVGRLEREAECLEARAKLMDPESPQYRNTTARLSRLLTELDAERMIAGELERQDPAYSDPFAVANPLPRGLDPRSIRTVRAGASRVRVGCARGQYHPGARGRRKCAGAMRAFEKLTPLKRRTRKPRTRKNPGHSGELARARRIFHQWHSDAEPRRERLTRVRVPARPRALARLGEVVSVTYESDKFAGTPDNPKGRKQLFEHETKRPRPVIASDQNGHVHLVGGRMRPTADGLIN